MAKKSQPDQRTAVTDGSVMGANYTPGRWTVEHGVEVYGAHSRPVADCGGTDGTMAEQLANARLIAAAPELLEALKSALPLLEGFEDADMHDDDEVPIVAPILAQARAAIAKAEGRS